MATNNNIKIYTAADIERYHKGLLSPKERHDLEKAALDDPFLADALEGYAVAGVNVSADLSELEQRLARHTPGAKVIPLQSGGSSKGFPWLRIAVMLVLLTGAGLVANQLLFNKKTVDDPLADNKSKSAETTAITDTSGQAARSVKPVTDSGNTTSTVTVNQNGLSANPTTTNNPAEPLTVKEGKDVASDAKTVTTQPVATTPTTVEVLSANAEKKQQLEDNKAEETAKLKTAGAAKKDTGRELVITRSETPAAKNTRTYDPARDVVSNRSYDQQYRAANTFRGVVTDNANRRLPFARVTNIQDNVGTYADVNGNFTLTSPDTVLKVQVGYVGFVENNVQLRNDLPANQIVMQDDRKSLAEVVISNQKPNTERRQRDANLKVEEPEPADGWENYDVYLANNLNMPTDFKSRETGKQEVEVSFEVDKNGEPTNIRVEKSLCKSCDQEAIRLVKEGPKWKRKAKKGRTTVTVSF